MNTRRALSIAGPAVVAAVLVAACGSRAPEPAAPPGGGSSAQPAAPEPVTVVASTDVYGSIVSAVGGDAVEVSSIIDNPSTNPHVYESTPADAVEIARAQLVVFNGAGFDPFVEPLIESAGTRAKGIDVSELSGLEAQVPAGEEFNEHVWYSLPTVKMLADTLAAELGRVDPAAASTVTANAAAFDAEVDGLVAEVEAINAAHAGKRVAITEPLPVEAMSADTQNESAATLRVEDAAAAAGVPIVAVSETLPEGTDGYVAWGGGHHR